MQEERLESSPVKTRMIVENAGFSGGYYQNTFELPCESEESGSSGRVGTELTASEDSSTPSKKCIKLNSDKENPYGVPKEVFSASNMSRSDRVDLVHRLRLELEQTKVFLKKAKLQRTYDPAVSSTSYIVSSSNEQKVFRLDSFRKSSLFAAGPGKKVQPLENNARGCNRSSSGRFESAKPAPASTGNVMLMKQCETLLKRLMSHQYSWVFNIPVDVEKLKIPDYYTVIKHPMDLGTIKNKLNAGEYSSPLEFAADVRLTFSNAMKYNPPKNDVHIMADTLGKFFEVRWKTIEKKLPMLETESLPETSRTHEDKEINKAMPPTKRRKTASPKHRIMEEPVKPVMSKEERHNLGRQLESLLDEIPQHIIDFLKKHSSNGADTGDDEIEIDIDVLSDDILFTLRKLLDDHSKEKQKKQPITEPCEIVLLNGSGPSSSSMQHGNELADEDVGGNQPPVSGSSSDSDSSSSENESDGAKAISQENTLKVPQDLDSEAQLDKKTTIVSEPLEMSESACGLDHPKNTSQEKPCSVESDNRQEGKSAPLERQVSSEKLYRAALLKNRFADIILKAREKALPQNDMGDPEKLRKEREVLELQKKKEKARLQAEAKAAEDARKRAEAEVAAETKRKIEQEREAARQALLKMERTVEINENSRFLEDLEMLSTAPAEHLPSLEDESKSPERCLEGLGSFKFGGSNPLEQLGLFMKLDDEEDEAESAGAGDPGNNDVEEGEID